MTPAPPAPLLDRTMRRIFVTLAVVGAMLVVPAGAIFGGKTALGVLLGAATAALNLFAFVLIARAITQARPSRVWPVLAVLKMGVLFGGLFVVFRSGLVGPLAFVLGYGSLPLAIMVAQAFAPREESP